MLCPSKGGALKPVAEVDSKETIGRAGTKFAHVFCSIWVPEAYFGSPDDMEPIYNIEGVRDERWRLLCSICKEKHGACIQCSHGTLPLFFVAITIPFSLMATSCNPAPRSWSSCSFLVPICC